MSVPLTQEPPPEYHETWVPPNTATGPLAREELQALSRLTPWRTALRLIVIWSLVCVCLELAVSLTSAWVTVAAFLAMAVLQNHLVLWTHEASHYGLSRRKALNDLLADLFISGPTGIAVAQYRWQHLQHHRYLGDPAAETDLAAWMCIRQWHLLLTIARHATGWFAWTVLRRYRPASLPSPRDGWPPRSAASIVGLLVANALFFALCALQGRPETYVIVWAGPLMTLTLLIGNLRTMVEHQPSSDICDAGLIKIPPITRFIVDAFQAAGVPANQLTGLELDAGAVERLRSRGFQGISARIEDADLGVAKFDVISMIQLIEHVADPVRVIERCRAALRPSGILLVETPNLASWDRPLFTRRLWGGYHFPRHWTLWDTASLPRLFDRSGFTVVHVSTPAAAALWAWSLNHVAQHVGAPAWAANLFGLRNPVLLAVLWALELLPSAFGRSANMRILARVP